MWIYDKKKDILFFYCSSHRVDKWNHWLASTFTDHYLKYFISNLKTVSSMQVKTKLQSRAVVNVRKYTQPLPFKEDFSTGSLIVIRKFYYAKDSRYNQKSLSVETRLISAQIQNILSRKLSSGLGKAL